MNLIMQAYWWTLPERLIISSILCIFRGNVVFPISKSISFLFHNYMYFCLSLGMSNISPLLDYTSGCEWVNTHYPPSTMNIYVLGEERADVNKVEVLGQDQ